jgi:leucyl-tRNA synthetase
MGPFDQAVAWDFSSIEGVSRFLAKVWRIHHEKVSSTAPPNRELTVLLHKTIKTVSDDIESMRFNTAVSACMIFANACFDQPGIPVSLWKKFLLLLAPFTPHIAEELWQSFSSEKKFSSVHSVAWPRHNPRFLIADLVTIPIQINGKMRDQVIVPARSSQEYVFAIVREREKLQPYIRDTSIRNIIFVPDKIMNIVV